MGEKPDAIAGRMSAKLAELAGTLESAIGAAQAQRETFATETGELSIATALTLHDVLGAIGRLAQSTEKARHATRCSRRASTRSGARSAHCSSSSPPCGRTAPPTRRPRCPAARRSTRCWRKRLAQPPRRASRWRWCCAISTTSRPSTRISEPRRRPGAALDRHAVQGASAARRHGGAVRERSVRRDHAALRGSDAIACAERFRQMLMAHELFPHPNGAGRLTVSLGVADAIKGDTPEFLLRRAANGAEDRQARGPQSRGGDDARRAGLGGGAKEPNSSARSCRCRPAGTRRGRSCRARDRASPPAARPRPTSAARRPLYATVS